MERKELDFAMTVKESFVLGTKNLPSITGAIFLWLVTIWIPYINVGTTIAISLLPVELAKGNVINPLGIFDSKWRRYMGEYFMVFGLMYLPILIACLFMFVPGVVLSIAWTLSFYFLIEKNKNPVQAIKASNDATYGSKWWIFLSSLFVGFMLLIVYGILFGITLLLDSHMLTVILMIIFMLFALTVSTAVNASIWRQLKDNVE